MNYHIGRLVLSSLCVGAFVAAGIWWCSVITEPPSYRIDLINTDTLSDENLMMAGLGRNM